MSKMGRYVVDSMERYGYVKPLPKPECPYLRKKVAGDESYMWCDLVDKWCLLEGDNRCEEYDNYLKELKEERSNEG